jgi:hypothetical protein
MHFTVENQQCRIFEFDFAMAPVDVETLTFLPNVMTRLQSDQMPQYASACPGLAKLLDQLGQASARVCHRSMTSDL